MRLGCDTKTDNHNLAAKLELRRAVLHATFPASHKISVCDCFSGDETIWTQLRAEFNVSEYLALDMKKKRGRIMMDSLRYLQNQVWRHDVIDLDCYVAPWRHWFEILKRGKECVVFITIGNVGFSCQQKEAIMACGITFEISAALQQSISDIVPQHCLAKALESFTIPLALEANNDGGHARYIGLRLAKRDKPTA